MNWIKLFFWGCALAAGINAAAETVDGKADPCRPEFLLSQFPEPYVRKTLKEFSIPEDKWDGIIAELDLQGQKVVPEVQKKGSQMDPNPLKDPRYQKQAVQLYREVLLERFSEAMRKEGIADEDKVSKMLADIRAQKAAQYRKCFKRAVTED